MEHTLEFQDGTDPRNHIVKCSCGWSFSSTYKGVRDRGLIHQQVFAKEEHRWDDPLRKTVMPPAGHNP
jgi:hypothetical protein